MLQSDACSLDAHVSGVARNPERPSDLPLRPFLKFGKDFLDSPIPDARIRFEDPATVSLVNAIPHSKCTGNAFFEAVRDDLRFESCDRRT